MAVRTLVGGVRDACRAKAEFAEAWIFGEKHALRGIAMCRIIVGLCVSTLLLANFSQRSIVFGPGSIWAEQARETSTFPEIGLLAGSSGQVFSLLYLVVLLASLAFSLGWHTRFAGVVTLFGFIAIIGQNPLLTDQGDNILRLTMLWLLLMNSSEHWSLDAHRRSVKPGLDVDNGVDAEGVSALRSAWNSHPVFPATLTNGIHNVALAGISFQIAVIYIAAGMYKIQPNLWENGTALYYSLQLPDHRPFPGLSDIFTQSGVAVGSATYAIVFIQLFFVPLLLNKITKPIVLTLVIGMHLLTALFMALPWSSFAMIALVAIFVSNHSYEVVDRWLRELFAPVGDWFYDRYYDALDVVDTLRERFDDLRFWVVDQIDKIRYR